jgi:hypothetical protein
MAETPLAASGLSAPGALRVAKAFAFAPLAGLCAGAIASSVVFLFGGLGGFSYASLVMFAGVFIAYPLALVLGIPVFLVLRRFSIHSLQPYLLVGVLLGAIGWVVASSPVPNSAFYFRAVGEGVFALVSGLVGSATFWAMAVQQP